MQVQVRQWRARPSTVQSDMAAVITAAAAAAAGCFAEVCQQRSATQHQQVGGLQVTVGHTCSVQGRHRASHLRKHTAHSDNDHPEGQLREANSLSQDLRQKLPV